MQCTGIESRQQISPPFAVLIVVLILTSAQDYQPCCRRLHFRVCCGNLCTGLPYLCLFLRPRGLAVQVFISNTAIRQTGEQTSRQIYCIRICIYILLSDLDHGLWRSTDSRLDCIPFPSTPPPHGNSIHGLRCPLYCSAVS